MEAPDWPVEETDSAATLTVTLTFTLTGGSSSDFLDVVEMVEGVEWLLGAGEDFPICTSALILLTAETWVAAIVVEAGVAWGWLAFSVVQFVDTGACPLAEEEGEWEGDRDGEGDGEMDGDGDVCGGSNGMVIHAWLRISSRWGLLWGRTFKHCLMMSWHSAKTKKK